MNTLSVSGKNWILKKFNQTEISYLKENFYLDEIVAKLLSIRNIKKEDININVDNNVLTIKGKKEMDKERKDSNYYSRERFYGDFKRSMSLPSGVKTDKIDASFKDGVLTIRIPKEKSASVKTIDIK